MVFLITSSAVNASNFISDKIVMLIDEVNKSKINDLSKINGYTDYLKYCEISDVNGGLLTYLFPKLFVKAYENCNGDYYTAEFYNCAKLN